MRLVGVALSLVVACSSNGIGLIQDAPDAARRDAAEAGAPPPPPPSGLLSLSVSPLGMSPAFSAGVYDYAVRCASGPNDLSVTMQTAAGSEASLISPIVSQAAQSQTVPISIQEDGAIVVSVSQSGAPSSQYWVRCLPHDFPPITLMRHPSGTTPTLGWYLTGNATLGQGNSGFAFILDSNATPVWYERTTKGALNLELLANDVLAYTVAVGEFGTDPNERYQIDVLNPWQTELVQTVGSPIDEHELTMMPNGDRLVFSYPLVSDVDLTGLGTFGPDNTVADCEIQELDAFNNLVWSWHGLDHIDPVRESTEALSSQVNGVTVIDPIHCNSIDLDTNGDLLVSARDIDAVFLIDRTTSAIRWKMGGTGYSKDSAQLVNVDNDPEQTFYHQHDARFLPSGNISLFDDHTKQPGQARGVVYALDLGVSTATFVWQSSNGTGNSEAMGSFRISEDQSRVIGWGISTGPGNPTFSEVDANGASLLDVSFGAGNWCYRTIKVPLGDLDIDLLRATTAHP